MEDLEKNNCKFRDPDFEIWEQKYDLDGIFDMIEKAGRICYASDDISGSSREYTNKLTNKHHLNPLEHATVYLYVVDDFNVATLLYNKYKEDPYSNACIYKNDGKIELFVTTNYRVLYENFWIPDLQYISEPKPQHKKRTTVCMNTQIAITREFNRHRVKSICEQSTRFCNFSRDKFDNAITINTPTFIKEILNSFDIKYDKIFTSYTNLIDACEDISNGATLEEWEVIDWFMFSTMVSSISYLKMIELGEVAQNARTVLPLCTNSKVVYTEFDYDWEKFFEARALDKVGKAHIDAKAVAVPLYERFLELTKILK